MATRLQLQALLESILGTRNVYFNPPSNIRMSYPCIVYSLDNIDIENADDINYKIERRYLITAVDTNPDSPLVNKLLTIPRISFSRPYVGDGLYHFAFTLYY